MSYDLILPFITAVAGILGTILTYWLVGKRRLTLIHRQRIIEHRSLKFHQYVVSYYMPIVTSIGNFIWRLEKATKGEEKIENEDRDEISFFFFARYLSTEKSVYEKLKGIFLRDRVSETILSYLKQNIVELRSKAFSRDKLSTIIKYTDQHELFTDFKPKLQKGRELREIFENRYKPWRRQMEQNTSFIDFLRCYKDLLIFEINEADTKSWYKENPIKLPGEDLDFIEKEILPELRRTEKINLKAEKKFLKKIRRS